MEEEQKTEVRQTNQQVGDTNVQTETVRSDNKVSSTVMAQRIIYYIGGLLIAILALRLLFQLLGANQGSAFVDVLYGISGVFVAPFFGIFGEPTYGNSQFETSTFVAIIIYALLTVGVAKLLSLGQKNPEV
tara:strand:- start:101 stop:493 length:393 start_codon:yes stop_codon:yes gene_type:complete